jgi:hypothetical protein
VRLKDNEQYNGRAAILDGMTRAKMKPCGSVVSISVPPDPAFAKGIGANWSIQQVMCLISAKTRQQAKVHSVLAFSANPM